MPIEYRWTISNQHEPDLYWSNEDGWVDSASATRFTDEEHDTLYLPDEGTWVRITTAN